jgi:hypothetical protein
MNQFTGLTFGAAIKRLKGGALVGREGWNGKGMYLGYCDNWNGSVVTAGPDFKLLPFIYLRTAQGDIVPWQPSQTDTLACDWQVVVIQ